METLFFGLDLGPIPENHHAINALAIAECVDLDQPEHEWSLLVRLSPDLPVWTALGMLEAAAAQMRATFVEGFEDGA